MVKEEICRKIEALRGYLHQLITQYGVDSEEVLKCSEELDELICELEKVNNTVQIKCSVVISLFFLFVLKYC